ncbi:unnamed protein product [Linum trigynum]|uniref:Uncharacterized protein n=1 Tax=Linum trigynum TaxID=586398 RepID=A0AAV2GG65_9ROSI
MASLPPLSLPPMASLPYPSPSPPPQLSAPLPAASYVEHQKETATSAPRSPACRRRHDQERRQRQEGDGSDRGG